MTSSALAEWQGSFGDAYVQRSLPTDGLVRSLTVSWAKVIGACGKDVPASILEVGSNVGLNLRALRQVVEADFFAVEPNNTACDKLIADGVVAPAKVFRASGDEIPMADSSVEMAFTAGVLIHVEPNLRVKTMKEIHRVSSRYVFCAEYFAPDEEEIKYRGQQGLLWRHDYGRLYLDQFPDLELVDYGFFWNRTTAFDNCTWWLLKKRSGITCPH